MIRKNFEQKKFPKFNLLDFFVKTDKQFFKKI